MKITDEMVGAAMLAYMKETAAEEFQVSGWLEPALRAALTAALVDVPAVESEPVALIEREVLAELQKHWNATGTVCSPLFKSKFGDKVPLYAHPPLSTRKGSATGTSGGDHD